MISDLKSFQDKPLQSEIRDLKSGKFFPESVFEVGQPAVLPIFGA
jgi:hypothetical protein